MFERFTEQSRRALVLAQEESRNLDHAHVGTEHILLALIREGDGVAAQVLLRDGVDLNRARLQVIELLHGPREQDVPGSGGTPAADDVLGRLASVAARLTAIELHLKQSSAGFEQPSSG